MSEDQMALLNLHRLPARLDTEQVAALLAFQVHDLPVLCRAGLLKPLGKPALNGPKWYATVEIEEKMRNHAFLSQATHVVARHWQKKNARKIIVSPSNGF